MARLLIYIVIKKIMFYHLSPHFLTLNCIHTNGNKVSKATFYWTVSETIGSWNIVSIQHTNHSSFRTPSMLTGIFWSKMWDCLIFLIALLTCMQWWVIVRVVNSLHHLLYMNFRCLFAGKWKFFLNCSWLFSHCSIRHNPQ